MCRRVQWVLALGIVVGACTGAEEPTAAGDSEEPAAAVVAASDAPVSSELCVAFFARRAAMDAPALESLIPLNSGTLEARQRTWASLDAALQAAAEGTTVSSQVNSVVEIQRRVDELMLQTQGGDGTDPLAGADAWDGAIDVFNMGRPTSFRSWYLPLAMVGSLAARNAHERSPTTRCCPSHAPVVATVCGTRESGIAVLTRCDLLVHDPEG